MITDENDPIFAQAVRELSKRLRNGIGANFNKYNPDSKDYYERKRAEVATAVTIEDGEVVEVDGRQYTVKVRGDGHSRPAYSDPIAFIPV